ncbi:Hypp7023 [Branchiostoma lanceolatum]|uniref:Hypp7023 protein n=1 Tax=Branchiostoma lanceolatum TaxID=7740 RepID=A0A8K0E8G7_BRALA|nr:Hypp7023 [Branchiostoma lanceolatum]
MSQKSRRSNSVSSQKSDVSERSERRAKSPRSPRSDRKDGSSERESSEVFHTECRAGFVAIVGNTKDNIKSRDQLQQGRPKLDAPLAETLRQCILKMRYTSKN